MGIILDIILVAIVVLSAFLGYKRGLVQLAVKLFAGIIAIVITLMLYKPVSNLIIENTTIDDRIENSILESTKKSIEENINQNEYLQYATDTINEQAIKMTNEITINIIYVVTALVIFIIVKILLSIIMKIANLVTELPILKQFNEVGGLAYGIIRGLLIVYICVLLIGIFIKFESKNSLEKEIDNTFITKPIYEIIVKF